MEPQRMMGCMVRKYWMNHKTLWNILMAINRVQWCSHWRVSTWCPTFKCTTQVAKDESQRSSFDDVLLEMVLMFDEFSWCHWKVRLVTSAKLTTRIINSAKLLICCCSCLNAKGRIQSRRWILGWMKVQTSRSWKSSPPPPSNSYMSSGWWERTLKI